MGGHIKETNLALLDRNLLKRTVEESIMEGGWLIGY